MKPIKVFCLMALVVVLISSFACSQNVQQSKLETVANKDHFSLLGFVLWSDTLEVVRSRLGRTELLVGKDHEPSEVCYVSSDRNDGTTVIFQAGFMGNRETLTSFILANKKVVTQRCLPSPLVSKNIATPSGIKIGLRSSQLKELLGEPTKVDKNLFIYDLITRRKMTEKEITRAVQVLPEEQVRRYPYADVSRHIEAKIAGGRVEQVSVTMIETY